MSKQYESRAKKSMLNAKVNLLFYLITIFLSFFSRKIFLNALGADFVGLTSTLMNLLNFLNLAELGIGSSISFVLYKHIFDDNKEKINEIISVFGYLYRIVGYIIIGAGLILACFLPLIFDKTEFSASIIYFAYFSFMTTSLIGYFINYRQTLLSADQKNYMVMAYYQTANVIKILVQMALAYYTNNYYLWIAIELIFGITYSFILNWKINRVYPWLKSSIKLGKAKYSDNKIIIIKARQLFVHKLAGVGRSQLLPFLIYAFTSLKLVAYYGNYMLLITKVNQLVDGFLGSTTAGVGSLIAEGDMKKIQKVFWELSSLRFMVASFLTFVLYHLVDPFITIWLGKEYVMSQSVVIVLMCNFFISQFRGTNDQFISGYGLFQDIWAPIATLIITVGVAIIGGYVWGLPGVLLGDIASSITIISIWKPYMLYNKGFHISVMKYWAVIFKYLGLFIAAWIITELFIHVLPLHTATEGYFHWIMFALESTAMFSLLFFTSMYFTSKGTRDLVQRILKRNK